MREFPTGAVRGSNEGKGRYDLIYPDLLRRLARRMQHGIEPKPNGDPGYGERNWEKGIPDSSFADSAMRHLVDYLRGDRTEDHLAAVIFNIGGLMKNESDLPTEDPLHDLPNDPDRLCAGACPGERPAGRPASFPTDEALKLIREAREHASIARNGRTLQADQQIVVRPRPVHDATLYGSLAVGPH